MHNKRKYCMCRSIQERVIKESSCEKAKEKGRYGNKRLNLIIIPTKTISTVTKK